MQMAAYVESAKEHPNKILVDARERSNFLTEHIPGARNIPYTMIGLNGSILRKAEEVKRFIENRGISTDSEIITYCGSVGTLSGLAYYALKLAGVKNVKLYSKSFREWKSLGKPKEEFKDANYWDSHQLNKDIILHYIERRDDYIHTYAKSQKLFCKLLYIY